MKAFSVRGIAIALMLGFSTVTALGFTSYVPVRLSPESRIVVPVVWPGPSPYTMPAS